MKFLSLSTSIVVLGMLASASTAQTVLSGDHSVDGELCVGANCTGSEANLGVNTIKLKADNTRILFEDSSITVGFPTNDWRLKANDQFTGGSDYFAIEDVDGGADIFKLEAGAPANSIYVETTGDVGIGTSLPDRELHVVDSNSPTLRLEQDGSLFPARVWDVMGSHNTFDVYDATHFTFPFRIAAGTPSHSLFVGNSGYVGLGTSSPEGKLHTKGDGVQLAYFESGDGGAVQVRFRTDSQNRRFLAVNNANEVKSQLIFRDEEILLTGSTTSGADLWLSVGPGGVVAPPPSCDDDNPCDRVFDPTVFQVPAIEERAALMWEQKYLPAIGPTSSEVPINLSEKTGGIIHELEVAHIYIEQLHKSMLAERERNDRLEAKVQELSELVKQLAE